MNKLNFILLIITMMFFGCDEDRDSEAKSSKLIFNFSHNWNGTIIKNTDFNDLKFINANGETLSIERLRYLISEIVLTSSSGEILNIKGYNLIDVTNDKNLTYTPDAFAPNGNYINLSFVFGLTNEMNIDDAYNDLNAASFDVPDILGGGYHYMQMDGKFINSSNIEQGYNFHTIRAVDNAGSNPTFPKDTYIKVNLGPVNISGNTTINIEMNVAEWFNNPNTWDLNQYNQMLMPNSIAQIMMYENGQNVFSLISVDN